VEATEQYQGCLCGTPVCIIRSLLARSNLNEVSGDQLAVLRLLSPAALCSSGTKCGLRDADGLPAFSSVSRAPAEKQKTCSAVIKTAMLDAAACAGKL
jgi:hypothetical protein